MSLIPMRVVALLWSSLILIAAPSRAAVVTANFTSASVVPVTAASYTATGSTVNITLNFAPPVGTNLTVVKITGAAHIQGTFDNLAQGQVVNLTYGGVRYPFAANYYGGSGNDLVLQWANIRLLSWGADEGGQLGDGGTLNRLLPVPVVMTGVLAGKTITSVAMGAAQSFALCADGSLAAWGSNGFGQLGNNGIADSAVPVWVDRSGVLAGKTIVAVATGAYHALVLCSDGSLAAWGSNSSGQLGDGTTTNRNVPVLVSRTGVLAGKTVVKIGTGSLHSLAICADGSIATWGSNTYGQLGNRTTLDSSLPVLVDGSGVLAGKTVVAVAGGGSHSIALCTDGTLATWGANDSSQLGSNGVSIDGIAFPVLVLRTGALSGKTAVAIAAGASYSLALCSDGTLTEWGRNFDGQLGIGTSGSTGYSAWQPVQPDQAGVLSGRSIAAMSAGWANTLVLCTDGTLATWGDNRDGQLGDGSTTNSNLPVQVNTSALQAGERILTGNTASLNNVVLVATPPPPAATTLAATTPGDTSVTLNGSVNANGFTTSVTFDYGLTASYGASIAAAPASLSGTSATAVSATPINLLAGTTYHYRVVAASSANTVCGEDMTFTTTALASLTNLTMSSGTLVPAFAGNTTRYFATLSAATTSISVTPVCEWAGSTVKVNGVAVPTATASATINLSVGNTTITTVVSSPGGGTTKTYTLTVTRLAAVFNYTSATTVPVTVGDFRASGNTAGFTLGFAPVPGTNLTVVKNTGLNPIQGEFDNLAQGQKVNLSYGGMTYSFVANYYGGSGNDLVLHWANTRLLAWGHNSNSELGNNSYNQSGTPVPVDMTGVLAGKTIIAISSSWYNNLALCADGTVAIWGAFGKVPVLLDRTGVLAGKVVTAVVPSLVITIRNVTLSPL